MDSNIIDLPPNDKSGIYKAPPHSEGGFRLVIDNQKVAEAEGYEIELCPSVMESNEILHYENKTNKQILDDIFQKNSCVMTQGHTTSGSFIVCKKAVLDGTKKSFNGSIKDFINSIQSEHECKVTEDAKEEFKKELGGDISAKNELKKGIKVEEEHRDTVEKLSKGEITAEEGVKEIAKAHLAEDPAYYEKLEIVENPFSKFIEVVKESKDFNDAFNKVKKIKDVPAFVSEEFSKKYNPEGKLSMEQSFKVFYDEHKSDNSENELAKLLDKKDKLKERLYEAKLASNKVFENMGWGSGMRKSKISISTTKEDEITNKIKVIDKRIKELKGLNDKEPTSDEINLIIRDLSTMDSGLKDYDNSVYKSGYEKLLSSNENSVLSEMRNYIQFQKDNAKYFTNKESKANADKWLESLVKLESKLKKDFSKSDGANEGTNDGTNEGVNSEKQELIDLIELLKDTIKENPKDEDSKDALELYQETLKSIESKFEKGGELTAEEAILNSPCINENFKIGLEFKTGGEIKNMTKEELRKFYDTEEGKELDKQTYNKWKSLVNMSKFELENFYNSEEGKEAGLSPSEAKEKGIDSGRESARWIFKMKDVPYTQWTPDMWRWAKKQISFISRMSGMKGDLYDDKGNKTRKHTSLLIWGHNPEKFENGGELQGSLFDTTGTLFAHGGKIEVSKVSFLQTDFSGLSFSDLGGYFDSDKTDVIDLEHTVPNIQSEPIFLFFKNPYDVRYSEKISIDDVIGAVLPKKMEKDARLIFDKHFISYVTYADDASNESKIEAIKKLADINEDIILK